MYEVELFREELEKRGKILIKGGLHASIDPKEMRTFLARFFYKKIRRQPYWLFVFDRIEDLNSGWGYSVAKFELAPNAKKYTIEVCKRDGLNVPSEIDLRVFDEFIQISNSEIRGLDHNDRDDNRYSASAENNRKMKAMAGDNFGLDYERASDAVKRCRRFLFPAEVERYEVSL